MPGSPEPLTLFVDRCLGAVDVPEALRAAGCCVETHDAHLPQDTDDEAWIELVGTRGWVALTKDRRVRTRQLELAAVQKAGIALFVLAAQGDRGDLTGPEMGTIFRRAMPEIERLLQAQPRPFIAEVTRAGAVSLLWPGGPLAPQGQRRKRRPVRD